MPNHPLGRGAAAHQDHRTQANRDALAYCLRLYFDGSLGNTMTKSMRRGQARTGPELTGQFVSLLELGSALAELAHQRADLVVLLEAVYAHGRTRRAVAEVLHLSPTTVSQKVEEGLNRLIDVIWRDGGQS